MDNIELTEQDLKKFKEIYLINCKAEQVYYKELETYYKSKGFNNLEEYKDHMEKVISDRFKRDMTELKRINKIYNKGGYLTYRWSFSLYADIKPQDNL